MLLLENFSIKIGKFFRDPEASETSSYSEKASWMRILRGGIQFNRYKIETGTDFALYTAQ
jgi:hypothetical protein